MAGAAQARIAADVGGTFTDIVGVRRGDRRVLPRQDAHHAAAHRRRHRARACHKAGSRFGAGALFLHGTTVAINTMLERSGAQTALVTTRGFRDIYEIGRINRPRGLQPLLPQAPAARRALAALRGRRAHERAGRGARAARRDRRSTALAATLARERDRGGRDPLPALLPQSRPRAAREALPRAGGCRGCSSPPRTSSRRSTASSSAPRPWPPTPTSDRASTATSARSGRLRRPRHFPARSSSCSRTAACSTSRRRGASASACSSRARPPA